MKTIKLTLICTLALLTFALLPARAQSPLGNALSFNGANQYVSVANFGAIAPTNEVTVEFWANANALAQQSVFLLFPLQPTNQFDALVSYIDGNTYWDIGNISIGGRHAMPNPPGTVGQWVHYALVASQSANTMLIYVNGELAGSKVGMVPFARGSYELRIGGYSGFPFNGRLDEFRVWNTARSQAQIQASRSTSLVGNEAGLLLHYKFDSASGTVATNSATITAAAYNGTLVNGPQWVTSVPQPTVVQNTNDTGAGSLRNAIATTPPGGTITFATNLSGATIALTSGQLLVRSNLAIDASALGNRVTISGNNSSRVLMISNNAAVVLKSLDISRGYVANDAGAGIYNHTNCTLTLTRCTLRESLAYSESAANGGGLYNVGKATLTDCVVSSNSAVGVLLSGATGAGGGIYSIGTLTLNRSTLQNNEAKGVSGVRFGAVDGGMALGGGLYNAGSATLNQNSFGQNNVVGGNGRDAPSVFDLNGNGGSARGGGIYNTGPLTLNQNTISANSVFQGFRGTYPGPNPAVDGVAEGGGVYNAAGTNCTALNCLIAGNLAPYLASSATSSDVLGAFFSRGHNLVGAANGSTGFTASGDLNGTALAPLNPRLGPRQDRGGPTPTFAPQPGSPAIDAGDDSVTNSFASDQRGTGFARRVGAHVDIGAFEVEAGVAPGITSVSAGSVTLDPQTQFGSVNVSANVNPNSGQVPATVWVQYGPYASYGLATAPQILPTRINDVPANQLLTDLAPGLTWHFRWVATNYYGTNVSADQTVAVGPQLYTQGIAAGVTVGESNVLNAPNTYGLYTSNQIQALNVDSPLLQKNPTNGLFKLTIGVQMAPSLTSSPSNFVAFPMNAPGTSTSINGQGKLEIQFPGSNNAAFFRLQSQ